MLRPHQLPHYRRVGLVPGQALLLQDLGVPLLHVALALLLAAVAAFDIEPLPGRVAADLVVDLLLPCLELLDHAVLFVLPALADAAELLHVPAPVDGGLIVLAVLALGLVEVDHHGVILVEGGLAHQDVPQVGLELPPSLVAQELLLPAVVRVQPLAVDLGLH